MGQTTIAGEVTLEGVGVHSGRETSVRLFPAAANSGILFHLPRRRGLGVGRSLTGRANRWEYAPAIDVRALWSNVTATQRATEIAGRRTMKVQTIEHLMAALFGLGVDNALVRPGGPEVPIMDGSALPFVSAIDRVGMKDVGGERLRIVVLKPVSVTIEDKVATLEPSDGEGLALDLTIDFPDGAIGRQSLSLDLTPETFRELVAPARTFGRAADLKRLQRMGFGRGASLDNAIGVDGDQVLNPEGLRAPDEFVRHKMLDAVGDLALAGLPLAARFTSFKGGHRINQAVLAALFADRANFEVRPYGH